jgi:hypothetical protein
MAEQLQNYLKIKLIPFKVVNINKNDCHLP